MQSLMGAATGVEIVPAHTYARLRFDDAADQAVQHLALVLQSHRGSPYEGQFVSQAEPRAGTSLRHFPADPAQHGAPLEKKPYGGDLGRCARLASAPSGFSRRRNDSITIARWN